MTTATAETLPPPEELAHGDFEMIVRRLADELSFGTDNSLFVGSGLEYASSRPYQPGDSVRMLNWRLTARTGRPYVKEYEALKRICIYILMDTSASMSVSSTALSKHQIAVWIAAAVGFVGQRRLSPVALIGAGERTTRLVPSLLRNDLRRALDPLRLGAFTEGTKLAERLEQLNARVPRSSVFVVLSDLHDPGALESLRHASQKHECVVIHTVDPAEAGGLKAGFFRARESETGRAFVGHSRTRWAGDGIKTDLIRCGADYLEVRTDRPFVAPLRHFLGSRGFMARGTR